MLLTCLTFDLLSNFACSSARCLNGKHSSSIHCIVHSVGLTPFTVYRVEVAAVNSAGVGPYSSITNQTFEGGKGGTGMKGREDQSRNATGARKVEREQGGR